MSRKDPLFNRRQVIKATVVSALSGGTLACTLFAPHVPLYWQLTLAVVAVMITNFAANTDLHLSTAPIVATENIENLNVGREPPPGSPQVTMAGEATIAPHPHPPPRR